MWNNYNHSRNSYNDSAYKAIKELIEDGLKTARALPADIYYANQKVTQWLDYSQKILEISTRELDKSILLNYLRLLLSIQSNYSMPAEQKINICLDYLLEVLKIITHQY